MEAFCLTLIPADSGAVTFLVLGSVSAVLMSVAKAGFGGSIGILSFPLMIYACGGRPMVAAGIMLPMLIICDYAAIIPWRGKWNLRAVGLLLPGSAAGICLGWLALWGFQQLGRAGPTAEQEQIANACLKLSVGAIALLFVVLQAVRAARARMPAFRPVLWQGACIGAAAGLTSTIAHAAGPIVSMYMLPQGMPKGRFVASTVLYYWIGNQLKLAPYIALGLLDMDTLVSALALMPAVVIGTAAGLLLHKRVPQRSFTGVVYVLLALAGAHLAFKAAQTLWF